MTDWEQVRKLPIGSCDREGTKITHSPFGGKMSAYCFCDKCKAHAIGADQ